MQRDRRVRVAVDAVAPDDLGGQVLRLRRAAAVAGDQQPTAVGQDVGQVASPLLGELPVGTAGLQRGREPRDVTTHPTTS